MFPRSHFFIFLPWLRKERPGGTRRWHTHRIVTLREGHRRPHDFWYKFGHPARSGNQYSSTVPWYAGIESQTSHFNILSPSNALCGRYSRVTDKCGKSYKTCAICAKTPCAYHVRLAATAGRAYSSAHPLATPLHQCLHSSRHRTTRIRICDNGSHAFPWVLHGRCCAHSAMPTFFCLFEDCHS